jgi:hypothetical protein
VLGVSLRVIGEHKEDLRDPLEMGFDSFVLNLWKVYHDGMENAYEFNKNEKCYTLEPMVEDGTPIMDSSGSKSDQVMLCSSK